MANDKEQNIGDDRLAVFLRAVTAVKLYCLVPQDKSIKPKDFKPF